MAEAGRGEGNRDGEKKESTHVARVRDPRFPERPRLRRIEGGSGTPSTRAASGEDIQVAAKTPEIEAEIVRLHYAEHWPVETIAAAPAPETTILI